MTAEVTTDQLWSDCRELARTLTTAADFKLSSNLGNAQIIVSGDGLFCVGAGEMLHEAFANLKVELRKAAREKRDEINKLLGEG